MEITLDKYVQGVSPSGLPPIQNQPVGFGYIFLPKDVDRKNYIESCYRTGRVSMIDDSSGNVVHECYISKEALMNISFPKETGQKGMGVIWVTQPFLNLPMIIGTFPSFDEIDVQSEEDINIRKSIDGNQIGIHGSTKEGKLFIEVDGQDFSEIRIVAAGNNSSQVHVQSTGGVVVCGDREVEISSDGSVSMEAISPETGYRSGFSGDRDSLSLYYSSGEKQHTDVIVLIDKVEIVSEFNETSYQTEINEEGVTHKVAIGESSFSQKLSEEAFETIFQDCTVKMEDGALTISQGEMVIELKDGKLSITNSGTGLNELLKKIVDAIATLTVSTAVGPSGTPLPPTIQKTTELSSLLKQFFNK